MTDENALRARPRGSPTAARFRAVARRAVAWLRGMLPRTDGVLLVTRSDLFPPNHGAAVKIDSTARGLAGLVSAVYVVTDDRRRYHRYRAGRREELRYPWLVRKLSPRSRDTYRRVAAKGVPPAEAFLYYAAVDFGFAVRAAYVAIRHGLRRYQAEFPAYARPCLAVRRLLGGTAALAEHNVEYRRLAEQYALSPCATQWLRDLEISLCTRVDFVLAVSELDREILVRDGVPSANVSVIPHGVDLRAFAAASPSDPRLLLGTAAGSPLLVYHGVYSYPPNLEAIRFLAREIVPRLHRRGVAPKILAIGPFPPPESPHPDIVFTGAVPDVAPHLLAADLAVVPLLQGGGTRMKILDYFAAGLAVVSTAKGVEGLRVRDGEQVVVRDDPGAFADAIADLLASPERRRALGEQGRRFVEALDWSRISERYLAEFREREDARADGGLTPRPRVGSIAGVMPAAAPVAGLPPFAIDDVVPFLRASSYEEPWHEARLVETARRMPAAADADSVYVDVGTHPLLIHAFARVGGFRRAFGVNWYEDAGPHRDVVVEEKAPAGEQFRYRIFNANLEWDALPFTDGCADVVTCLEVIEHLTSDPSHLLIELNRILRPGGTLLLSTPNIVSWRSALQLARRQHPMNFPYFFPGHCTNRHNIEYTPAQVGSLLRSAGFEGDVRTFDVWTRPTVLEKTRLVLAGFGRRDRGDCILAAVRKTASPPARYDPLVYQLTEAQLRENERIELTYRER